MIGHRPCQHCALRSRRQYDLLSSFLFVPTASVGGPAKDSFRSNSRKKLMKALTLIKCSMTRSRGAPHLRNKPLDMAKERMVISLMDMFLVPKARPTHQLAIARVPEPASTRWIERLLLEVA